MKIKISIIAAGIVALIGCAPKLLIKDDPSIREIAICTQISPSIPDTLRSSIDSVTNTFISNYNNQNNRLRLVPCRNDDQRTLYLNILRVSVTDPGKQAAGVCITTAGLITPLVLAFSGAPFVIAFAYLPNSAIQGNMKLSNDISENEKSMTRPIVAGSGKYFGSYANQKNMLLSGYYFRLLQEMRNIERRYK